MTQLAKNLGLDYIIIGKHISKSNTIQAVVYSKIDNKFMPLTYDLAKTPCEQVQRKNACVYNERVAQLFPEDYLLSEMCVEGYVGVSYESDIEEIKGVFVGLTNQPIQDSETIIASLKLFSQRIANELEREGVKILDIKHFY